MGLKEAIKNTIEYAAKFGSDINEEEIKERLISKKRYSNESIDKLLKGLKRKNQRNHFYEEKIKKVFDLVKKIKIEFDSILFLGVSGSVASGHPKKNDDIDIFIITKSNKLWRTRLYLRWWIYKNKIPHRRSGKEAKKDEFCFNLWLDENHLLLPREKQNLNNSVDLVLLKPLINKNYTYEKFILINDWAKKWVATPYKNKISNFQPVCRTGRFLISNEKQKTNKLEKIMNYLYFWPQYWYMRRKIRKEKVGLYQAFFHQ
jgi:hypothetical protein